MPTRTLAARPETCMLRLAVAEEEPLLASPSARTISGLAVPYGPVGRSSLGPLTFAQGSLTWASQVGRIKLLEGHDADRVVGFATTLEDTPQGLRATFEVPASPEGDRALTMAADGRRDGLSVGVMLDAAVLDEVLDKWLEGDDSATAASGALLEVSLVSLPAFDDARSDGSAAASLDAGARHLTLSVPAWGAEPTQKESTMPTAPAPAAPAPAQAGASLSDTIPAQGTEPQPGPAPSPRAAAGAALEVHEAATYTFDGRGPSFVRDVYTARFNNDQEAAGRLAKFQSAMSEGSGAQMERFLTAAVETRSTLPTAIASPTYRPDLLIEAIDKGRPLVSRIGTVNLTDATPFRVPIEGEFSGVGDHTEGTAHVAEGDMNLSDTTITPGAVSGAYRISRELVDASNPAIDAIAVRAMMRDYRRVTEGKVVAALAAADPTPTLSVNTVAEVRVALNAYQDIDDLPADLIASSTGFYAALLAEVDGDGRPMLPFTGPMNVVGTVKAGYTGASVDGVEVVKVSSLTGGTAGDAFAFRAEHILIGESSVQTFRFEEVEGPGVIKLALWAYFAAKALRPSGVVRLRAAAS